ncbi:aminotransferase class V-fold PLP-dependent enzyme [Sediminitomix flava]|uniref:Cysteine desulfurase n=1 Tax=Sediminitomix flava TaxID=379075 RepID=A0A315Z9B5_SEDFL|nr:cysteine desulfurase [Sediminitomix flava]PWJ40794.1 cysteine desulfurase/selenocysteine lyase [Sediminitomix flava]
MLDIDKIRKDFPILHQEVNGHPLAYFDNAATTQKPISVIEALDGYYRGYNSNVHRGAHFMADKATRHFEDTRTALQKFLNAKEDAEIVFTKGTTESINLVAQTFGKKFVKEGDEIIISAIEHHANIVPWQMLCEEKGATLKVIPVLDNGALDMSVYDELLSEKTKLVSVVYASNALGTINPVREIIKKAHAVGAKVMIDGAQSSSHLPVDVQELDCDFYALSGHKLYGPTGFGALFGKKELLEQLPPFMGGGEMIKEVTFEKTTYNDVPFRFEPGTPNIADTIAMRLALEYVDAIGKDKIAAYETELLNYATDKIEKIDGLNILGTAPEKVSVISLTSETIHPYDLGMMLDARGIAIRTGHHCAQPLMKRFGIEGTARISMSFYNTEAEIDRLVEGLERIVKMFG